MPLPNIAHVALVGATIPSGRVAAIDTAAAIASDGVLVVLTHENWGKIASQPPLLPSLVGGPAPGETFFPMQDEVVHYAGQPVAVGVADTLEQAQYAATPVDVSYAERTAVAPRPPGRRQLRGEAVGDHDRPGPGRRLRAREALRRPDAGPEPARQRRRRGGRRGPAGRRPVPVRGPPPPP